MLRVNQFPSSFPMFILPSLATVIMPPATSRQVGLRKLTAKDPLCSSVSRTKLELDAMRRVSARRRSRSSMLNLAPGRIIRRTEGLPGCLILGNRIRGQERSKEESGGGTGVLIVVREVLEGSCGWLHHRQFTFEISVCVVQGVSFGTPENHSEGNVPTTIDLGFLLQTVSQIGGYLFHCAY